MTGGGIHADGNLNKGCLNGWCNSGVGTMVISRSEVSLFGLGNL